jgi:hypothetical protein
MRCVVLVLLLIAFFVRPMVSQTGVSARKVLPGAVIDQIPSLTMKQQPPKELYETLGKLADIIVVFDPRVQEVTKLTSRSKAGL